MANIIVGPYSVPADDPIMGTAKRIVAVHLDQRIKDLFLPGEVLLQSTRRPNVAPEFAWGFHQRKKLPPRSRLWVDTDNPFVEEAYTCVHELGHAFNAIFGTPEMKDQTMALMINVEEDQGWNEGLYTDKACFVPSEGFADAFAKSQDNNDKWSVVLPRFFKVRVPASKMGKFLDTIVATAKRRPGA